jgi:phosphodiesterase/alkaline phosphatase D-like protein
VQTYSNQVPFVSNPGLAGLNPEDIQSLFEIGPAFTPQDQSATYPQSVASGNPQSTGIVLWTRITPTAMGAPSADNIAWQIAPDAGFASILVQGVATVNPTSDNTVKLPISNAVLAPYTVYYYRFIYNLVPSRTGRSRPCRQLRRNLRSSRSATSSARTTTTATTQRSTTWHWKMSNT